MAYERGEKRHYLSDNDITDIEFRGAFNLLRKFFGVSNAQVEEDGKIRCQFKHQSADGLSEETRWCTIDPAATPEETAKTLLGALAQQRWYQQLRTDAQSVSAKESVAATPTAVKA